MLFRISAAANSFFDLTTRIDSHDRETPTRNPVGPNEFTDFEHFAVPDTQVPKTILTTNWPNHPGDGVTLEGGTALRVIWGTRARSERPPAGPEKYTEMLRSDETKQNFQFFEVKQKVEFLPKTIVTLPTPVVLRISAAANSFFDLTTRIDSHDLENPTKYPVGPNQFADFEHFPVSDT